MKDRPQVQDFDWPLLAIVGVICLIGVLEIYSSTHASAMVGMQWKQLMWIGIGILGMFLISRIDYHTLLDQAPVLYLVGIVGLFVGILLWRMLLEMTLVIVRISDGIDRATHAGN